MGRTVEYTMHFTYDANGTPLTVIFDCVFYDEERTFDETTGAYADDVEIWYIESETYYYITNIQGDVIELLNSDGESAGYYRYGAWGNNAYMYDNEDIMYYNPLRYRGYFRDPISNLYYLQTRFYDAKLGRFISADAYISTGQGVLGNNMFAYCGNNPVIRVDIEGFFWDAILDVVSLVAGVADVIENPDDPTAWLGVAADAASLVIPCVSGGGALVRAATKADDVIDAVKVADKADDVIDTVKTVDNIKVHGNSLASTKETVGYALRKNDTHEIMKYGETTRGVKRYTNKFYNENGVYMDIMERGSKYDMHYWQHKQIIDYYNQFGHRPPWNKSFW